MEEVSLSEKYKIQKDFENAFDNFQDNWEEIRQENLFESDVAILKFAKKYIKENIYFSNINESNKEVYKKACNLFLFNVKQNYIGKNFYSVEFAGQNYNDDVFTGTYSSCKNYLEVYEYSQEDAKIVKFEDDFDGDYACKQIIDDWENVDICDGCPTFEEFIFWLGIDDILEQKINFEKAINERDYCAIQFEGNDRDETIADVQLENLSNTDIELLLDRTDILNDMNMTKEEFHKEIEDGNMSMLAYAIFEKDDRFTLSLSPRAETTDLQKRINDVKPEFWDSIVLTPEEIDEIYKATDEILRKQSGYSLKQVLNTPFGKFDELEKDNTPKSKKNMKKYESIESR